MSILASGDAFPLIECSSQGSQRMALIKNVETGFYRIPLPVTLSDSTHGEIKAFELITIRASRFRRRGRCRIYLYRGPQRRIGSRYSPAGNSRIDRESGSRRYRSDLAARLVGAALRRTWRAVRPGTLGARHRAVGFEGAARRICRSGACWADSIAAYLVMPVASISIFPSRIC